MERRTDKERLLDDVLAESNAGFHAALLHETLRLAHRRRRGRVVKFCGSALVVLLALAGGLVLRIPRAPVSLPVAESRSYELTLSQPLPATKVIETRPLAAEYVVVSTPTIAVIRSTNMLYRELGDDELLALAPQAALVRRGPHEVELVFVSPVAAEDSGRN